MTPSELRTCCKNSWIYVDVFTERNNSFIVKIHLFERVKNNLQFLYLQISTNKTRNKKKRIEWEYENGGVKGSKSKENISKETSIRSVLSRTKSKRILWISSHHLLLEYILRNTFTKVSSHFDHVFMSKSLVFLLCLCPHI